MKRTVLGCACSCSWCSGEDTGLSIDLEDPRSITGTSAQYSSLFPNFVVMLGLNESVYECRSP